MDASKSGMFPFCFACVLFYYYFVIHILYCGCVYVCMITFSLHSPINQKKCFMYTLFQSDFLPYCSFVDASSVLFLFRSYSCAYEYNKTWVTKLEQERREWDERDGEALWE